MNEIIFDLDGTLWDPTDVVLYSWNEVLGKYPEVTKKITIESMRSVLGLQIPQIGEKLFPYLDPERSHIIMDECCKYENEVILQRGGKPYFGLEETLKKMSEIYPMYIISNCNTGYIEAFLSYHKLDGFFADIECAGNTGLSKGENIKLVVERNNLKSPVYVGDTQSDCDACKIAGVPFIYAAYGFGNADSFDKKLNDITELPEVCLSL